MTAKKYLQQYQKLKCERVNLLSEMKLLVQDEAMPPGIDYSADRIQGTPVDKMFAIHLQIEKRSKRMEQRLLEIQSQMEEICSAINAVDDAACKRLLWLRYIEAASWAAVAKELEYTRDYVKGALHAKALRLIYPQKRKDNTQ